MKKAIISFFVGFYLLGCNGQDSRSINISENGNQPSFEEKQRRSLGDIRPEAGDAAKTGFNFRYAAKKATPGVVHIMSVTAYRSEQKVPDFFKDFFGDDFWQDHINPRNNAPQVLMGSASGVIVSDDGYIVTNNHVVAEADTISVVLYDQRTYTAEIIGTDPATDLALLKIAEKNLTFIEFGNSDSVEVGDVVLAVGNPFNLASTVTAGIISAKARNINILTDQSAVESYLQTDAAVNRGNSGGALVDITGKLVGINSAISTPTGVYAGYAFAIPVEIVKKTINDLLRYGKVMRGYLGVVISDMNGDKAKRLGIKNTEGVLVDSVQLNGAALEAGIKRNDVITKIDGHVLESAAQLQEFIVRHKPGDNLQVTVVRNGKETIIPVKLRGAPDRSRVAPSENAVIRKLGIEVENISKKEKEEYGIPGGVKIKGINKGIISRFTDVREGFIITRVNGKVIKNIDDLISELQDKKGGVMLEGFYPGMPGAYYYAFGL